MMAPERFRLRSGLIVGPVFGKGVEYVRADLHENLKSENAALTAKVMAMETALRWAHDFMFMHGHKTGNTFEYVRRTLGLPERSEIVPIDELFVEFLNARAALEAQPTGDASQALGPVCGTCGGSGMVFVGGQPQFLPCPDCKEES